MNHSKSVQIDEKIIPKFFKRALKSWLVTPNTLLDRYFKMAQQHFRKNLCKLLIVHVNPKGIKLFKISPKVSNVILEVNYHPKTLPKSNQIRAQKTSQGVGIRWNPLIFDRQNHIDSHFPILRFKNCSQNITPSKGIQGQLRKTCTNA